MTKLNTLTKCIVWLALLPVTALAQTDALKLRIEGNNFSDEAIVRFVPDATEGYDGNYDAWKLFSMNQQVPSIYTRIDSLTPLSINGLPIFQEKRTVEIFVDINAAGSYTIIPSEPGPFAAGVCIMLEEVQTGNYYDLRNSSSPLSFSLGITPGSGQALFKVHFFTPAAFSVNDASCFGSADGQMTIIKPGVYNWEYTLKDSAGNTISNGMSATPQHILTGLAAGSYNIDVINPIGCTESMPFTVSEPGPIAPAFSAADSAYISQAYIQFTNNTSNPGIINYLWDFGDGSPNSTSQSPAHAYTTTGSYTVTLTASSGSCSETVSRIIDILPDPVITSVHAVAAGDIKTYASGNMLVVEGVDGDAFVTLYNMLGQPVIPGKKLEKGSSATGMSVSPGYYLVEIEYSGKQLVKKLFVAGK
jgi:PKD repeat protein